MANFGALGPPLGPRTPKFGSQAPAGDLRPNRAAGSRPGSGQTRHRSRPAASLSTFPSAVPARAPTSGRVVSRKPTQILFPAPFPPRARPPPGSSASNQTTPFSKAVSWPAPATARASGSVGVALPDQAQPLQRQQVVDLVDRLLDEGHQCVGQAAGRDHRRARTQLGPQATHDPIHLAGEPV